MTPEMTPATPPLTAADRLYALPFHKHPAPNGADMASEYVAVRDVELLLEALDRDRAARDALPKSLTDALAQMHYAVDVHTDECPILRRTSEGGTEHSLDSALWDLQEAAYAAARDALSVERLREAIHATFCEGSWNGCDKAAAAILAALAASPSRALDPERLAEAIKGLPVERIDGDGPIGHIEDFDLVPPKIEVIGRQAVLDLLAALAASPPPEAER